MNIEEIIANLWKDHVTWRVGIRVADRMMMNIEEVKAISIGMTIKIFELCMKPQGIQDRWVNNLTWST